jgi:hypothetical protein
MDKPEFRVERGPAATDEPFAVDMAKLLEREGRTIAAAELRRLHAENDLLGSAADKLRVAWRDEVHRLYAENAALAAALASSCDEQRHELWESGGIAGCERARVAERQRDALLEALKTIDYEFHKYGRQHWPEAVKARAAIKKVEGENHAKSL